MNQPRSLSKLISTNTLQHAGYLAVAKTRAKALKAFSYVVPVRRPMLFVGEESCDELCDMLINENNSNVFIVTDAVLNSLGIPAKVTNYLDSKGISYHVYDGVTPDPTFTVVENGIDQYAEEKCDSIVAIGGGSVIDAAKMIAMSQGNQCQPQQLIGILKARKPSVPLYCIPTTAGTGSEATLGAVVSDEKTHQKALSIDPRMVPLAAAIDPTIMKGMPAHITADTGVDVLTHALEAWMSANANVETDYYAASAVKAVMKYLPLAYQDGANLKAREEMGIAAHYGGIAFNKAGLGYVHAIAHQLGAYYGIPHGRANAIVLPYILDVNRQGSKKRLAALAKRAGMVKVGKASSSDDEVADQLIADVRELIATLNIDPTVKGIQSSDFDSIAKAAAKEVSDTYAVPTYLSSSEIKEILLKIEQASANTHENSAEVA
ncbi:iron-containing alcohol dehydrogenase [Psychrobacter sp.]|uniref:iron-containing alcohol dehydrogenase n=1 Tax=Psychrobacter sp. TaxID=56811 RepID=UPI002647F9E9|nr:iron-containing alcohol dehydrogenase [Psychrobacter sp.]MDN6276369.1 iron-containing alcohol dehydrogenase [Psychrobacter sp.]MDN6307881.1 iron-containing alcohol dehydrogenase [Psychrobacter sp.]